MPLVHLLLVLLLPLLHTLSGCPLPPPVFTSFFPLQACHILTMTGGSWQ
jgi:hypothetical protein